VNRLVPLLAAAALAACASSPLRQVPDDAAIGRPAADAYRRAAAALDDGRAADALREIGPAAAIDPWHVPSHALRQDALAALGRGAEARAWYESAAAASPGDPARALLAARTAPRDGGLRERSYRAALAMEPHSVWARIALAYEIAHAARDESDRATALADTGYAVESLEASANAQARSVEAEQLAEEVAAEQPKLAAAYGAVADVLMAARRNVRGERATAAVKAAEKAALLDPGSAASWARVARARRLASDDAGAVAAYKQAIDLAPRDAALRAEQGRVLLDLRLDADAEAALAEAARLVPEDVGVAVNRGVALFRRGEWSAARAQFEHASRLAPLDPRPLEGLALTLAEEGRRKDAAAAMERYLAAGGPDRDGAKRFIDEMGAGGSK
jgi:tetratricopeptide (TPR) repeat protein